MRSIGLRLVSSQTVGSVKGLDTDHPQGGRLIRLIKRIGAFCARAVPNVVRYSGRERGSELGSPAAIELGNHPKRPKRTHGAVVTAISREADVEVDFI